MKQSESITIELGPVEEYAWSGMARGGPVDTDWRLQLRIDGEYVPPMGRFNIDGEYNITLPPYNLLKTSAEFVLGDEQTFDSFIGRIDWPLNAAKVAFQQRESTIEICLTYNNRDFARSVSERAFAAGLVESGREYLKLAREEVIPKALEQTSLYEPEAEVYHEELDELAALLDDLEDSLDALETNER